MILTHKRQRDAETQESQRKRLRETAYVELRLGLRSITFPFFDLFEDRSQETRFSLVPSKIHDSAAIEVVSKMNVRSMSLYDPGTGRLPWYRVLKDAAERGSARVDRATQIYAAYMEAEVLELLSQLMTSEFLVVRLQGIQNWVEGNKDVDVLRLRLLDGPDEGRGYREFWEVLRKLDLRLGVNVPRLEWRL
jgi:hypothetical protein